MKKYRIRTAKKGEIYKICKDRPLRLTKAWAIEYNGDLAAIAGVQFLDSCIMVFSEMKDINAPKITKWRAAKEAVEVISKDIQSPLFALCDKRHNNSGRFLQSLGFEYSGTIKQGDIYRWQTL